MSWGQTQYDYYDSNAVAGGANRALNGIVIMAIIVIVAIALLFIAAGVLKIYYLINPSADPEIQRKKQLQEKENERKKILDAKRDKAIPIAIDLGLSVKWASFNLGAYCSNDIGTLITWGNNGAEHPKQITDVNVVGEYTGNSDYDAATYKLGKGWRVPSEKECEELINKCKWEYQENNGVRGYLVTGPSSNSIFLPYNQTDTYNGSYTYAAYWTSSPSYTRFGKGYNAKDLRISHKQTPNVSVWNGATAGKCLFGIRPIFGENPKIEDEVISLDDKNGFYIDHIFNIEFDFKQLEKMSKILPSDESLAGIYNKDTTIRDEFGVVYSIDGKRLIDAGDCRSKDYCIKEGTEVICENAFTPKGIHNLSRYDSKCKNVTIPSSVIFIGLNGLQCNCTYTNESPFYEIRGTLLIDLRKRSIVKCIDNHITKVIIGDGIQSIEASAFQNCRELRKVILPESLSVIGKSAFMGCERLEAVNIPKAVTLIADTSFYMCKSLKDICLSNNISIIERCAFGNCETLSIPSLPISLKKIGDHAFSRCKSISGVLANGLTEIGNAPFPTVGSSIRSDSVRYKITNGILIDEKTHSLVQIIDDSLKEIKIPESINTIKDYAFSHSQIEKVSIPDSVTNFGKGIFWACKHLIWVNLPNSMKEIPSNFFAFCESLSSVCLPQNIQNIGIQAFYCCKNLHDVILGNNVRRIERAAFKSCHNLTAIDIPYSVDFIANAFESSGVKILNYNACDAEINFPTKCFTQINIGEMVEVLPQRLFAYNAYITKQIVPGNVRLIKRNCFEEIQATEIYIDSTDIKFEDNWISGASCLKTIHIRAEIYDDVVAYMPNDVKIKKIYPHKFLFFKWVSLN